VIKQKKDIHTDESIYKNFWMTLCFDFTMFFFRSLILNNLMHRPLPLTGIGLHKYIECGIMWHDVV